jgi:hypothetical protein
MKDAERLMKFITYKSNLIPDLESLKEFLVDKNAGFKNHIEFCKQLLFQFVREEDWLYAEATLDYLKNEKSYVSQEN